MWLHLLVLSLDKSYLPSKRVGLGSPLAACSMYGDLTCSVHIVNNFHCFVIIKRMRSFKSLYVFVFEDNMLVWHSCQICYPLEIKLLLLLFLSDCKRTLPVLQNGTVEYSNATTYLSQALLVCEKGFYVNGSSIVICESDGKWNYSSQTCNIIGNLTNYDGLNKSQDIQKEKHYKNSNYLLVRY